MTFVGAVGWLASDRGYEGLDTHKRRTLMREQEATAGGTIGKLTGRAKELAGTVQKEERGAELEAADLKQKAQRAEEAASLIEHKGKS